MPEQTLENRVAALEAEIALVRAQMPDPRPGVWGRTDPQRIHEMFGIFANEPLFDHMVERMQAQREHEQQVADAEP